MQLTKSSLKSTLSSILSHLSYPSYDVGLQFVAPRTIRTMNKKYRSTDSETDVLSFPFYDSVSDVPADVAASAASSAEDFPLIRPSNERLIMTPGVLPPLPSDSSLGSVEDQMNVGDMFICLNVVSSRMKEDESLSALLSTADSSLHVGGHGVSARMAGLQSLPARTHLLLVHSVLHLVGYDHVTDEDEKVMTAKEEEVIRAIWIDKV